MGSLFSRVFSRQSILEGFMISYLSRRGPTPYNIDLLPGGSLQSSDDAAVIRHKFKMARRQQQVLREALSGAQRILHPCLSPVMVTDFNLQGDEQNVYSYNWDDQVNNNVDRSRGQGGFGNLERLVTPSNQFPGEEIASYEIRDRSKDRKRCRSRPEPIERIQLRSNRQAKSATEVNDELPPAEAMSEAMSEVTIEKIVIGKRVKKCWPPREVVNSVIKDPKTRPTTYFLGRFRKNSNSKFLEVDYRFNQNLKDTNHEHFSYIGNLEDLLSPDMRIQYQEDKLNNNLDEKRIFLKSLPYFFNNYEGRMWWNGYLIAIGAPQEKRLVVESIQMNLPALRFDMTGLQFVSAARCINKLTLNGSLEEGGPAIRSFSIKGRTDTEVKHISLHHDPGTVHLTVDIPILSGSPSSASAMASSKTDLDD